MNKAMTQTQTILLVALGVLAVLAAIVALTLGHHIGGFLRTVEREAAEEAEAREREAAEKTVGEATDRSKT